MKIKNAVPHFRNKGLDDGRPFIVLEQSSGDNLKMFENAIRLRLPPGTTPERAIEIKEFLSENIVSIDEF